METLLAIMWGLSILLISLNIQVWSKVFIQRQRRIVKRINKRYPGKL